MKQSFRFFGQMACFIGLFFFALAGAVAASNEIGEVANMEGSLSAKGADGALRPLANKGKVLVGDTLFTGKDSYARIKFTDGGQISLRPKSQFKIEKFNYDEQQPGKDAANFNLLKGAMRSITGIVGKRGDPDSYNVKTREATAGVRGTKFGIRLCQRDCEDVPLPADGKPIADGSHFDVLEGTIIVKNSSGAQILLNAGQFGYVSDTGAPPVEVPADHAVRVEVPAKISLDNFKGANAAMTGNKTAGDVKAGDRKADQKSGKAGDTPNACPL